VSFVVIKLVRGRARAVHPLMYVAAAAFVLYFVVH
jgi:AGZA family xanthine/uracil permease-like MFS transporter